MELSYSVNEKTAQPKRHPFFKWLPKIKEHLELIAALFSGVLILFAWATESYFAHSMTVTLYLAAFVIGGFAKAKEGIEETIANKDLNVELLMIIAAIGSAVIGYWMEGAILIFIFALSGALETYTMNKSEKELSSLMKLQPEEAIRIHGDKEEIVPVSALQMGDHIFVKAGERIPADGKITRGRTAIDESAITGESMPVEKQLEDEVFAGTVNLNGSLEVELTKSPNESVFQKIIHLVQSAKSERSPSQLFIERFEGTYVKVVLIGAALMMFLPHYLIGWSWQDTLYRAMIFLVVASPCALVASIMPATLSGISNGARHGILFKGGVHLENLSHIKAIALDKTGTLTNGEPEVTDFYAAENEDKDFILNIAGSMERESTHPLAKAVVQYAQKQTIALSAEVDDMINTAGNGISASISGSNWKIGKAEFIGTEQITDFYNGIHKKLAEQGKTVVFVSRDDQVKALFALKDTVREDAKKAIRTLNNEGIQTVMITGDNETTAKAIAEECGITEYYANCLPEEKVEKLKALQTEYQSVAMTGDGINDAPALATSNLGIAMGEGTDVALETADMVLMKNDLPKIAYSVSLSKKMNRIVKQNVIFSISVIAILLLSNFMQSLNLPLGVVGHEGSTILVILNGLRMLKEA
ncbi:cadmium-translocating P-type ATPase [Virgibacillus sp. MSP4-1]|uniref:heavy metal translocating P-type ATPase n=1 Tax=Virgibacillus sp. MSP4-1 TaxID=2700081 RepID=UPI0005C5E6DD|nr:heavy metal translocating P-type ATPase [Virgibacillus sp. MSP4-1]QHS24605.1 cadmium-translocating P-type ATPase [Virgibacillus sp. MSP4-1]